MSSINLFEEATSHQQRLSMVLRRGRWTIPVYGGVIIVSVIIMGLVGRTFVLRRAKATSQAPVPVFFEVKAIDESGHPIVGADVLIDEVSRGRTDSYGEWRQYLRWQPGSNLRAAIEKKSESEFYSAVKNIIVPLQPKGPEEIEVRQTMVVAKQQFQLKKEPQKIVEQQSVPSESPVSLDFNYDRISIEFEKNLDKKNDDAGEGFVNLKLIPSLRRHLSRLGISEDASSPWKLKLALLTIPSAAMAKSDLVRISSEGNASNHLSAKFLRNVIGDSDAMAANLLETLRMHIPFSYRVQKEHGGGWSVSSPISKSDFFAVTAHDFLHGTGGALLQLQKKNNSGQRIWVASEKNPCADILQQSQENDHQDSCQLSRATIAMVPPKAKWQKIEILVTPRVGEQKIDPRTELYVLGFPPASIDENLYRFWAPQNEPINLTWVEDMRVIAREKYVVPQDLRIKVEVPRDMRNVAKNANIVRQQERL